jgi:hypothetical protein
MKNNFFQEIHAEKIISLSFIHLFILSSNKILFINPSNLLYKISKKIVENDILSLLELIKYLTYDVINVFYIKIDVPTENIQTK